MKSADDRLYALERKISDLTTRLQNMERERYSLTGSILRLGITRPNPDTSSYPSGGDTVHVRFVDATFTEESGTQTVTKHNRTEDPAAVAHVVGEAVPAQDTLVLVVRIGNRWWIVASFGGLEAVLGKTNASHAKGADGTINVYTGTAGSETDSGSDITAHNKFGDVASGKWVICLKINSQWYLIAAEC